MSNQQKSQELTFEQKQLKLLKKLTLQNETIIALLQRVVDATEQKDIPKKQSSAPQKPKAKSGKEFIKEISPDSSKGTSKKKVVAKTTTKTDQKSKTTPSKQRETDSKSPKEQSVKKQEDGAEKQTKKAPKKYQHKQQPKHSMVSLPRVDDDENSIGEENPFAILKQYSEKKL